MNGRDPGFVEDKIKFFEIWKCQLLVSLFTKYSFHFVQLFEFLGMVEGVSRVVDSFPAQGDCEADRRDSVEGVEEVEGSPVDDDILEDRDRPELEEAKYCTLWDAHHRGILAGKGTHDGRGGDYFYSPRIQDFLKGPSIMIGMAVAQYYLINEIGGDVLLTENLRTKGGRVDHDPSLIYPDYEAGGRPMAVKAVTIT